MDIRSFLAVTLIALGVGMGLAALINASAPSHTASLTHPYSSLCLKASGGCS